MINDQASWRSRIVVDPRVCNGKPVVRGTRITVQTVLEFLSAGDTPQDILDQYPSLTADDIQACLAAAAELMNHHYSLAHSG